MECAGECAGEAGGVREEKEMRQMDRKSKKVLMLAGFLLLAVVGVTVALYVNSSNIQNRFTVAGPGAVLTETFDSDDHWLPGEQKTKEVKFANTGGYDMLLRFWVEAREEERNLLTLCWDEKTMETGVGTEAPIGFTKVEEGDRTYYYYNKVLKPGEDVLALHSVKLSEAISNDNHGSSYSGKKINLTIKGEMILAFDAKQAEAWNKDVVINRETGTVVWKQDGSSAP